MTNQEALKKLKDIQKLYPWGEDSYKVIDYAIRAVTELPKRRKEAKRWRAKALEQEPCEDAISRQAMHIELEKWITYGEYKYSNATKYLYDRIDRLPPVNPQEPCSNCCNGNQIEKAKFCQKSYLAGMAHKQEPKYCDRNICLKNEYNGIGCDECEVMAESEEV